MSKFIVIGLICFSLILAIAVNAEITGTIIDGALACHTYELDEESKDLLNRWIYLNRKYDEETLTLDEAIERHLPEEVVGQCAILRGGTESMVIQLDGLDYLVELCTDGYNCVTVIMKSEGFDRNND